MTGARRFIIVGASLAGAKAAQTLREEGFEGSVVLLGEESVRPYERPPLSKDYLQGNAGLDKVFVHDENYYDDHEIELRLSSPVQSLDTKNQSVVLVSGERLDYDSVLLATGATPRRLEVPGSELEGLCYLRNLDDADRLRVAIGEANRIVVIGGGWIGCEVAVSARQMGAEVALVESAQLPLERVLGPELGSFYRDLHAEHGVELHFGTGVASLRGAGRVEELCLVDGTTLSGDVFVVGWESFLASKSSKTRD